MKKISVFLAAVLLFTAALTVPSQSVKAFSSSEMKTKGFRFYVSVDEMKQCNVEFTLYNNDAQTSSDAENAAETATYTVEGVKASGMYAALTLSKYTTDVTGDKAIEGTVVNASDFTVEEVSLNDNQYGVKIKFSVPLPSDLPDGFYMVALFNEDGSVVKNGMTTCICTYSWGFTSKPVADFSCYVINDDGYAYAYVSSENISFGAEDYPIFYDDNKNAITTYDSFTKETTKNGETVYAYKLKINDNGQNLFTNSLNSSEEYLYYKLNSDSYHLYKTDVDGYAYTNILDYNEWMEKYGVADEEETDSTTDSDDENDDDDDDDDDDNAEVSDMSASASNGGESIPVSIYDIQSSSIPEVQASINNLVNWVSKVSSNPADVVTVLRQYAPLLGILDVQAGGTLELSVPEGYDISSGVPITFTNSSIASNVKSGDRIVVLHVKHDGSIEYVPATANDGSITATFTSLSPVAWYKVSTSSTSTNPGAVSPKTGFNFWDYILDLIFNK
jgi:hypothetical protein